MKKLPADTTITNYEYQAYEPDHSQVASTLADLPQVEGFVPFSAPQASQAVDSKPVVQPAVFQDFAQVVKND
jgi:hypothetical protein